MSIDPIRRNGEYLWCKRYWRSRLDSCMTIIRWRSRIERLVPSSSTCKISSKVYDKKSFTIYRAWRFKKTKWLNVEFIFFKESNQDTCHYWWIFVVIAISLCWHFESFYQDIIKWIQMFLLISHTLIMTNEAWNIFCIARIGGEVARIVFRHRRIRVSVS